METVVDEKKVTFVFKSKMDIKATERVIDYVYRELEYNSFEEIQLDLKQVTHISLSFINLILFIKKNYLNTKLKFQMPVDKGAAKTLETSGLVRTSI